MSGLSRAIRRTSLVVSGIVSLVAALLLAERIIRPGVIEDFGTIVLVGLLMLFLLPAATMLALRHDRRQALVAAGRAQAEAAAAFIAEAERKFEMPEPDARLVRHGAHTKPAVSAGRSAEGPNPGSPERSHTYQTTT